MLGKLSIRSIHVQPKLKYPIENGVSPCISPRTLDFHYNKHHAGYVKKLNKFSEGTEFEKMDDLVEVIRKSKDVNSAVYNNAAQAYNHALYFESICPNGKKMSKEVESVISEYFGGVNNFVKEFSAKASSLFGSGWCWLVYDKTTKDVDIVQTSNADTPVAYPDKVPLLVTDVWEHAYYLDYQNRRPDYVGSWFDIIDWEEVEKKMKEVGLI